MVVRWKKVNEKTKVLPTYLSYILETWMETNNFSLNLSIIHYVLFPAYLQWNSIKYVLVILKLPYTSLKGGTEVYLTTFLQMCFQLSYKYMILNNNVRLDYE